MKMKNIGALILGCVMGLTALCAPALATGESEGYSLTVNAVSPDAEENLRKDIESADVVLDIYLVAAAEADDSFDAYHYIMQEAYGALSVPENVTNDDWRTLAQQAAKIALDGETPLISALPAQETAALDAGLYLVIARGETVTDYVTYLPAEAEGAEPEIATVAQSDDYVYTYAPQLVTLPGKEAADDGSVGTAADYGEWLSDVTVTLKPDRSVRYGALIIEKTVSGFGGESAVFLFQIEGVREDGASFSDVVAIHYPDEVSKTVERIPTGMTVTVTEVYTGAAYTLTSENDQTAVISAEDIASVAFENTYNSSGNSGSAVVNHFEYMGEDLGWDWNGSTGRAPQD